MFQDANVYEAQNGFTRKIAVLILSGLGFVLLAIVVPMPLWLRLLVFVFFDGGGLLLLVMSLRRAVVIRVDTDGVTLVRLTLMSRATRCYRWQELAALVIWQQVVHTTQHSVKVNYFGVLPTSLAQAAGVGHGSSRFTRASHALAGPLVATSVQLSTCRLDRAALDAVRQRVAPGIPMVQLPGSIAGSSLAELRDQVDTTRP
jgi:hypothetical protein